MTDRSGGFSDGFDAANKSAFDPEHGWFWYALDEVRDAMYAKHPDAKHVIGDMSDEMVENLMTRVGLL